MYPAYPRHYFSLRGLVHIYIPQTGTPCGRVLGRWSYSLSWASALRRCHSLAFCTLSIPHFVGFVKRFFSLFWKKFISRKGRSVTALIIPVRLPQSLLVEVPCLLTSLLYHTSWGLSRGFLSMDSNHFYTISDYLPKVLNEEENRVELC